MADEQRLQPFQADAPNRPDGEEAIDEFFGWMGRDGMETIERVSKHLHGIPLLQDLIDALPIPVALLNDKAQIVLMNRRWFRLLGEDVDQALGKRYGELLGCIHAADGLDGCGTSRHCARCGAFRSILSSGRSRTEAVHGYHLQRYTAHGVEAADLVVTSTPIEVDGHHFTVFALQESLDCSSVGT